MGPRLIDFGDRLSAFWVSCQGKDGSGLLVWWAALVLSAALRCAAVSLIARGVAVGMSPRFSRSVGFVLFGLPCCFELVALLFTSGPVRKCCRFITFSVFISLVTPHPHHPSRLFLYHNRHRPLKCFLSSSSSSLFLSPSSSSSSLSFSSSSLSLSCCNGPEA